MKIRIDLKIFVFIAIFFLTKQLKAYSIIMGFALIHEFAHIIIGIILKYKTESIELTPLGFCAKMQPNIDDYNKKYINASIVEVKYLFVAIAGPLLNILLSIVFIKNKIYYLGYPNLIIAIFNLIPIFPLDGGRIIHCIFKILLGSKKSDKIDNIISNVFAIFITICGSIGILYFKNIAILLVLIYIWFLVIKENKKFEIKKQICYNKF